MQHSNHSHPLVHESLDLSNPSYWSAQSTHESNQPVQKQSSIRPKPLFIDTSFSSMLQSNGMSNGVNMDMIHTAPAQSHRTSNVLLPAQTSPEYPQSPSSGDEFYQVTQKSAKRAAKNQAAFSDNVPMFIIQNPLVKLASVADSERYHCFVDAKLEGRYFMHDGTWTCYRRNQFRVLATLNMIAESTGIPTIVPAHSLQVIDPKTNARQLVSEFFMTVTGEQCAGNGITNTRRKVEIITQASKQAAQPIPRLPVQVGGQLYGEPLPPKTPISPDAHQESFHARIVSFDRLQFRTATLNNGKRKAIQQHFRVVTEVWARLVDGEVVKCGESMTENMVVRGRSPGHYADMERTQRMHSTNYMDVRSFSAPASRVSLVMMPDAGFNPPMMANTSGTNLVLQPFQKGAIQPRNNPTFLVSASLAAPNPNAPLTINTMNLVNQHQPSLSPPSNTGVTAPQNTPHSPMATIPWNQSQLMNAFPPQDMNGLILTTTPSDENEEEEEQVLSPVAQLSTDEFSPTQAHSLTPNQDQGLHTMIGSPRPQEAHLPFNTQQPNAHHPKKEEEEDEHESLMMALNTSAKNLLLLQANNSQNESLGRDEDATAPPPDLFIHNLM